MSKQSLSLSVSLLICATILQQSLVSAHEKPLVRFAASESFAQAQSNAEYRIKPKDLLHISIEGACIYNPTFEVDERSMIQMPFIDEVGAAGRTEKELESEIANKLNEYLKNPKVHVRVIKQRT